MHNMRISIGDSCDYPRRRFQEAMANDPFNLYSLRQKHTLSKRRVSG